MVKTYSSWMTFDIATLNNTENHDNLSSK